MKIDINQPIPNPYPFNTPYMDYRNFLQNFPFIPNNNNNQKALEDRIAYLEKQLAEKNDFGDMDKKLSETEEGCKLLRAKYDGATQLLIEWAMTNPALSQKLSKFLDGWKSKSEEYLKSIGG